MVDRAADLVLTGGSCFTCDAARSWTDAIAVTGRAISAVGGAAARALVGPRTRVVDLRGRLLLPGFVDAHVHAGLAEEGQGWAGQDTNERTDPVTPQLRALDGINPDDLGLRDAIGGGVLAVNVNPGSANPIGGQTVAIRCWGRTVDEMVLREPAGLKSALGENPKRVYGERHETPSTRPGTAGVIRSDNFQEDDSVPSQPAVTV